MSRGIAIFKLTGRTGGSVDKLDSIDGSTGGPGDTPLQQGDLAFVIDAAFGVTHVYELDVDSGQAENDPYVITPDSNAGNKRWKLRPGKYLGDAEADSLSMSGVRSLSIGGVHGGNTPVGAMLDWSMNTAPNGWLLCDGTAVSRSMYSDLFAVVGTVFGGGDGSSTFNVPDFRGRVAVGRDSGDDDFNTLGSSGGEKKHALTETENGPHKHSMYSSSRDASDSGGGAGFGVSHDYDNPSIPEHTPTLYTNILGESGQGQPHNILQPYVVVNKIIKY
ncbi:tail fiber protein [Prosthecochloris sp. SCSIO W1101]|uniref:phage tail protein n=1 Tax=Prosthecochloris sp. SCSIO W1101 TaxID=2992242 RepID=UPI00223CDB78|nr:tail fiber protein [Prosthecochloris sp. SCSIO W1101]UZJ41126.1 tail fiber protein [Prosthecochloris sp. SCSIO W1101]